MKTKGSKMNAPTKKELRDEIEHLKCQLKIAEDRLAVIAERDGQDTDRLVVPDGQNYARMEPDNKSMAQVDDLEK